MNSKLKRMKMKLKGFRKVIQNVLMVEGAGNQNIFSEGECVTSVIMEKRNFSHVLLL